MEIGECHMAGVIDNIPTLTGRANILQYCHCRQMVSSTLIKLLILLESHVGTRRERERMRESAVGDK